MCSCQVGSDDDGYAVRLRLEHFLRYCCYPHHAGSDDSPLYIFDGTFADRSGSAAMAQQYAVPKLFREDLFQLAGEKRRPPYRSAHLYWGCRVQQFTSHETLLNTDHGISVCHPAAAETLRS